MPSLVDSPPQLLPPAAGGGGWSSLYAPPEPVKPPTRDVLLVAPPAAAAAAKKPAYGGRRKNVLHLEMCTEALGCETGGVDAAADVDDGATERKRRSTPTRHPGRRGGALPPPLTTLARGGGRVRMVRERRDGRLAVYAVRAPGMEAERSGGRLRLRLQLLPCAGGNAAAAVAECNHQEPRAAEAGEEAEDHEGDDENGGAAMYVRGSGRCVEAEGGTTKWEAPEQASAFWVATT